jgi:enamine deaminase RidA (YjgF/YER057c/UK114 family)
MPGPIKRTGNYEVLHEVVEHDGVIYLGGVVSDDLSLDMAGQTRDVLGQIDRLLAEHGSSRDRLLSSMIFITDMRLKPEMNTVWKQWLASDHLPTRATIGVSDLGEGVLLEIVVTAATA